MKSQWAWGEFKYWLIQLNKESPKFLFVYFVKWHFCPGCKRKLCSAFPSYVKEGILLSNQVFPQRRSICAGLSWDDNTLNRTSAKRARGNSLVDLLNHVEASWGEKVRVAFLSIDSFGLLSIHWGEYYIATKSLPISCWWGFCKGRFALLVRTSYVLLFPEMEKKDFSCQIRINF